MTTTSRTFHLYRFQIVPIVGDQQLDMFSTVATVENVEELVRRKNEFLAKVISEVKEFTHPRAELTHKLYATGSFFVLKIGANRSLVRITKEFKEEELDNWPSVYVVINNDPNSQLMAVELETEAFYRTSTVVHIISDTINKRLRPYGLVVQILPTFVKNEFWNIVKSHKNRVTQARFYMVAPNLANISKNLELDLEELKSRTNSIKTNMSLQSPSGEALSLSEDDSFTNSLVEYSSEGGGTIHLKVRGVSKLIKTEDSIKSVEVDEIHFTGHDISKNLVEILRKILS